MTIPKSWRVWDRPSQEMYYNDRPFYNPIWVTASGTPRHINELTERAGDTPLDFQQSVGLMARQDHPDGELTLLYDGDEVVNDFYFLVGSQDVPLEFVRELIYVNDNEGANLGMEIGLYEQRDDFESYNMVNANTADGWVIVGHKYASAKGGASHD